MPNEEKKDKNTVGLLPLLLTAVLIGGVIMLIFNTAIKSVPSYK